MAITKQADLEVDQIRVRVTRDGGGSGGEGVSMQGAASTVDGGRRWRVTEGQPEVRRPSKRAEKHPVPNEPAKKGHPMEQVAVDVDMVNHSVA